MKCSSCYTPSILKLPNSEISLCKKHFCIYFEKKVRKTIRVYRMIDKQDKVGIAISGGKDSMTLLYVLHKIFKLTKVQLHALAIDEGISGYRDPHFIFVRSFCDQLEIPLHVYSFEKEIGMTLDQITQKDKETIPCTYCGVFRRKLLNEKALELGMDKLATGHNLDDEAQSIIMNQFRKNVRAGVILGPVAGVVRDSKFIPRIKPLYFLTEKEVTTFAYVNKILDKFVECPNAERGYRSSIRDMLNNFEARYPGTKHNIVSSFLATVPLIKKSYMKSHIHTCKLCGAATSKDVCQACVLLGKITSL